MEEAQMVGRGKMPVYLGTEVHICLPNLRVGEREQRPRLCGADI